MPNGTAAGTADGTDAGTDHLSDQQTSSEDESEYQPPCRAAEQTIAACPICWRRVRIKTLRYSHRCARTFRNDERAMEQLVVANVAVRARMSETEQHVENPLEPKCMTERLEEHRAETIHKMVQHVARPVERAVEHTQRNYANLLNF